LDSGKLPNPNRNSNLFSGADNVYLNQSFDIDRNHSPNYYQFETIDSSLLKNGYNKALKRTIYNFDPSPEERNSNYIRMRAVCNSANYKQNEKSASRAELLNHSIDLSRSPKRRKSQTPSPPPQPVKIETSPTIQRDNSKFIKAYNKDKSSFMKFAKKKVDTHNKIPKKKKEPSESSISYDNLDDLKEN